MKLSPRQIAAFVKRPDPAIACVLFYGPDRGLVRERAGAVAAGVVGDDPFAMTDLAAADLAAGPASLGDAARQMSLTGGRRLVRVRDADDSAAPAVAAFLATTGGDALVVLEAGDLGARSALRRLFDAAANAAAVPCYADGEDELGALVAETLGRYGLRADGDALAYLIANLGSDRGVSRSELEKLALYKGEAGSVTLDDAMASVGDSGAASLEAVAFAAGAGDQAGLDRALERAFAEGASAVGLLRATAAHLQRLHLAVGMLAGGASADQAIAALRPLVFFKVRDAFVAQLRRWPAARLAAALDLLTEAELGAKTTGAPDEALCRRALMRVAQAARSR